MNAERLNREIKIAIAEYGPECVDWGKNPDYQIVLRGVRLPSNINHDRSDLMLRVPADFGHPAGAGIVMFFRNVYLEPGLTVRDPRTGRWVRIPRYYYQPLPGTRWHYICVHKATAAVSERTTILDFVRTVQLYLANCLTIG